MLKLFSSSFDEIQLAYLSDSHAKGREMPISDLDIAILTRNKKTISYLTVLGKIIQEDDADFYRRSHRLTETHNILTKSWNNRII